MQIHYIQVETKMQHNLVIKFTKEKTFKNKESFPRGADKKDAALKLKFYP